MSEHPDEETLLPALFVDTLPDELSGDLLALAHLSDVEEEVQVRAGPIRKSRSRKGTQPYKNKPKSEEENWQDRMKELDFRAKAWKPFSSKNNK
jgi:hypothetical protein